MRLDALCSPMAVGSGRTAGAIARPMKVSAEQRRALKILADAGLRGCTGATLLAYGFSIDMLASKTTP